MMPLTDMDRIDEMERDEALASVASAARRLVHERDRLREVLQMVLRDVGDGGPASDYVSNATVLSIRKALQVGHDVRG